MAAATPFEGLPLVDDDRYVIHDTPTVQYLIKNLQWLTRKRFKLQDHQFSLGTRVKSTLADDNQVDGKHAIIL